jgi:hypothetical protein
VQDKDLLLVGKVDHLPSLQDLDVQRVPQTGHAMPADTNAYPAWLGSWRRMKKGGPEGPPLRSPVGRRKRAKLGSTASNSMEGAREGATAQHLDRVRALFGKVCERLCEVLIEFLAGGVTRPREGRDIGYFQVVAQREAREHRHAPKDRRDVGLDDRLRALAAQFLGSLGARPHESEITPAVLRRCDSPGGFLLQTTYWPSVNTRRPFHIDSVDQAPVGTLLLRIGSFQCGRTKWQV